MPGDIFALNKPDHYAVIGRDVTPPHWSADVKRVALDFDLLLWSTNDILDATANATDKVDPLMPEPMQFADGTVVIEGPNIREEFESQLAEYDGWMHPTEEATIETTGIVLRAIALRLTLVATLPTRNTPRKLTHLHNIRR